ncbi:hypothetical protein SAMN05444682_113120 [Parapedobacter indicus]|uniref:Uncharacterized protein n=1 Tax=Parapedobacter indicus TaxID=1477437 RepID=A0A1I3U0K5_9SPHI|nr:hypothetical protein CLV26_113120 [Parapedobacter indicus]SFJ75311.1 hypothetical protein SAMN05444682_113120 [Parapedobacter indicus]
MIDHYVLKLEKHSLTSYKPICLFFLQKAAASMGNLMPLLPYSRGVFAF